MMRARESKALTGNRLVMSRGKCRLREGASIDWVFLFGPPRLMTLPQLLQQQQIKTHSLPHLLRSVTLLFACDELYKREWPSVKEKREEMAGFQHGCVEACFRVPKP